jgi:hypothetical protein
MIDRQQQQSGKVTLEDLLHLKRAERPRAEFWTEFDRTLHAKQLAAIVEKRPWWRRQYAWRGASRWSLPLSAAAALAVTFATVGHPTLSKVKSPRSTATKLAATPVATATLAAAVRPSSAMTSSVGEVAQTLVSIPSREDVVPTMSLAALDRKAITPVFVAAASTAPAISVAVSRPSSASHGFNAAEQIAGLAIASDNDSANAHFASVSTRDSLTAPVFGSLLDKTVARLDTASMRSSSRAIEPLAQMPTPKEARRARLVALLSLPGYDDASDSSSTVSRSRERSLSHFNDQAMYDAISRLEMKSQHHEAAIQF